MTTIQLEVILEDRSPHKWRVPLKEDVFVAFIAKGGPIVQKIFGDKSLFGPLLLKKFFDPSDAFPLWEFEPGVLLSDLHKPCVDWFQTEAFYILKTEMPKLEKNSIQVSVENGNIMEICGLWKHKQESRATDWRTGKWWEHGFVRRLELPENADWKKIDAYMNNNDTILDIRIPKTSFVCDIARNNEGVIKECASASA